MKKISLVLLITFSVIVFANFAFAPHQGCTPGYWKNHINAWIFYVPGQTIESALDPNQVWWWQSLPVEVAELGLDTLIDALKYHGGPGIEGAARILLRQLVAGLLNARDPNVNYWTIGNFMSLARSALIVVSRDGYIQRAGEFTFWNELGCPLGK